MLRLKAGSQESGYLAAIFPLPKTPTLVIVKNGELKEYLAAGVSKTDFMKRMQTALGSHAPSSVPASTSAPQAQSPDTAPTSNSNVSSTPIQPEASQSNNAVQNLLAERGVRLEAQKKERDAKEKAKRIAEAKAKRKAIENAEASSSSSSPAKSSADMNYALMQKKRQQEARDERARILKRVEDDKAERREKETNRKAQAKALADGTEIESSGPSTLKQAASTRSKECAIQIRLFDGSTIRSRFPSSGSLAVDVRPWIASKQESDTPYTFKQVLTPLPNKNIEMSEEEQDLQTLGLTPSATLILLPVTGYTSAYEGDSGYVSRGVSAGYGVVSSGVGMVSGLLGSLFGGVPAPASAPVPHERTTAPFSTPSSNINVRTLRDQQDKKDDQQFYNGNAVSLTLL